MEEIAPINRPIRQTWFFAGLGAVGFVVLGLAAEARDAQGIVYGAFMLALGAFGVVLMRLSRRNSRLLIGSGEFGYRDAFGRTHTWYASQVSTVLDMSVVYNKSTPPRRAIYVIGLDGRRLTVINTTLFSDSAIDRFTSATGKPVEVISDPVPVRDFKQRYPNAVGWILRHSMMAGTFLALGLGAIVVVAILAVTALTRR